MAFKNWTTPKPRRAEDRLADGILIAFNQGAKAERAGKFRSENPYRPSQEELYQAWNCGYDEEDVKYVVANTAST